MQEVRGQGHQGEPGSVGAAQDGWARSVPEAQTQDLPLNCMCGMKDRGAKGF